MAPINRGAKVYALLREALQRSGRIGVARVVIQTKQHLAAMIPAGPGLVLNLLRWGDEVKPLAGLNVPAAGAKGRKRTVFFVDEAAAAGVSPDLIDVDY